MKICWDDFQAPEACTSGPDTDLWHHLFQHIFERGPAYENMSSPYKAHQAQLEATECPELFSQYDFLGEYFFSEIE